MLRWGFHQISWDAQRIVSQWLALGSFMERHAPTIQVLNEVTAGEVANNSTVRRSWSRCIYDGMTVGDVKMWTERCSLILYGLLLTRILSA